MDSILELDPSEIRFIKETISQNKDLFIQNAPALFEDCFNILLSSQAKAESFNLLKQITSGNDNSSQLSDLFNAVLSVCSNIFKSNLKGTEEFAYVVDDLGLKSRGQDLIKVFQTTYLQKVDQLQNVYDDEQASMTQQYSKKFPLNLTLQDESLQVTNSRILDIEWKILYCLSSKNLNKLFVPRFKITLVVLGNGEFLKGGAIEEVRYTSKREYMRLKRIQFECDHEELTHLLHKIKSACNSLENFIKK